MRIRLFWILVIWGGLSVLIGCAQTATPTPVVIMPTVETAVTAPTVTEMGITPSISPTMTPLPIMATVPPPPTATPLPAPQITIDKPVLGSQLQPGSLMFVGQITPLPEIPPLLELRIAGAVIVSETTLLDPAAGQWALTLTLPPQVVGPVQAIIRNQTLTAESTYTLIPGPDSLDSWITLSRPVGGQTAVTGYTLLFAGQARNLVNRSLTLSVLTNSCTNPITTISFSLEGGDWFGQLIIPQDTLPGEICAIAYTGERGDPTWREARTALTLLSNTDPAAATLTLGNPEGFTVTAGQPAELYGVATEAPGGVVHIRLTSDEPGQSVLVLAEGTAVPDTFGYWSFSFASPAGFTGQALLTLSMGEGDEYIEVRTETAVTP